VTQGIQFADAVEGRFVQTVELRDILDEQQTTSVAACYKDDAPSALGVIPASAAVPHPTPVYGYKIVNVCPHDRTSYTQGLEYRGGYLYEGTFLPGRSKLRKLELETGKVLRKMPLAANYFGEGITLIDRESFNSPGRLSGDLPMTGKPSACSGPSTIRMKGGD
jgi:hypothetical protein